MPNPTSQVPQFAVPFTEEFFYWPLPAMAAGSSGDFYPGEMIGVRLADGYADHFDDTEPLLFLGFWSGIQLHYTNDQPQPVLARIRRPKRFSMPLASGTASRLTDLRKVAYATDSGKVQMTPTGLTYANVVGRIFDIVPATPETLTGATHVQIEPGELSLRFGPQGLTISPTALAGAVNDYAPTGIQWSSILRIDPGGAARNITGILAGVHGQRITLVNLSVTATQNLVLKHEDAASAAANRFHGANAADVTVRAAGAIDILYDGLTGRWRPLTI